MNNKTAELPLLGIRKRVLYPGVMLRLTIGRTRSVKLVEQSLWDPSRLTFRRDALLCISTVMNETSTALPTQENRSTQSDPQFVPEIPSIPLDEENVRIYTMGTIARVLHLSRVKGSGGKHNYQFTMLVEGVSRARVEEILQESPFTTCRVKWKSDLGSQDDTQVRALAMTIKQAANDLLETQRSSKHESTSAIGKIKERLNDIEKSGPSRLADMLASNLDANVEEKQGILEELRLVPRLNSILELINRQMEVYRLSRKIQNRVEGKLKNTQREYLLRQQLKAIKDELHKLGGASADRGGGHQDDEGENSAGEDIDEVEQLEKKIAKLNLPKEVRTAANREVERLNNLQPSQPEYSVIRTYLEWIVDIPWDNATHDNLDVRNAKEHLDHDHFALEKVKKRMIQFLAVRSLKRDMRGPILCLVGPPGVGKTSLGRSIAEAVGRKFRRIALGGVRDEAEIRGHRRTYIGAMPGNMIHAMKKAGTTNPVILLDEIDKLGRDARGDPGAALLEVLDPEQNNTFTDHYLNVPYDLSNVMFIATANRLDTIPGPLLDRMEVIQVPGYTSQEKVEIAKRHLLPKQLERHGITTTHIRFAEESWMFLLNGYTREAGVRGLDREIAAICREAAVRVAEARVSPVNHQPSDAHSITEPSGENVREGNDEHDVATADAPLVLNNNYEPLLVTPDAITEILGPHRYESEVAQRTSVPGVATGMAWTQVGGEILFVEASMHRGTGKLQLTGQLGKVMEESVRTALSFVRAHFRELHLDVFAGKRFNIEKEIASADLHVHFPAGAVPKDGPSAGVAITAALVSAISGRCVRSDTACTGEITLRGLVLPVGGIKEKVIAAHRAGVKRIVLPQRNEKDVLDIPKPVKQDLDIIFVDNIIAAMHELFPTEDAHAVDLVPSWRRTSLLRQATNRPGELQHVVERPSDDHGSADRCGPELLSNM